MISRNNYEYCRQRSELSADIFLEISNSIFFMLHYKIKIIHLWYWSHWQNKCNFVLLLTFSGSSCSKLTLQWPFATTTCRRETFCSEMTTATRPTVWCPSTLSIAPTTTEPLTWQIIFANGSTTIPTNSLQTSLKQRKTTPVESNK